MGSQIARRQHKNPRLFRLINLPCDSIVKRNDVIAIVHVKFILFFLVKDSTAFE